MNNRNPVYLGFASAMFPNEKYRLKRQYLPLGKVGGRPAWLDPVNLPESKEFICSSCTQPLSFLLQVYCTDKDDPVHAFHRTLFVFVCKNADCSKPNDASNIHLFRCQLPRVNDYYNSESALNPSVVGNVPDPFYNPSTYTVLCSVCGCRATKKCGRCAQQWYCSKEHQVADWTSKHKLVCGNSTDDSSQQTKSDVIDEHNFNEYAMDMDMETNVSVDIVERLQDANCATDDDSSDEDEVEMADQGELDKKTKQLMEFNTLEGEVGLEGVEENTKDVSFKHFQNVVSCNPKQILRYSRNGTPLYASDHSPVPDNIPKCLCGAERSFEFQLMPHLLSLLGVDCLGKSLDWATVLFFTCSKSCRMGNDGYTKEFVHKQDFVDVVEKKVVEK